MIKLRYYEPLRKLAAISFISSMGIYAAGIMFRSEALRSGIERFLIIYWALLFFLPFGWLAMKCWQYLLTKPANLEFMDLFPVFFDPEKNVTVKELPRASKPSGATFFRNLVMTIVCTFVAMVIPVLAASIW